MNWFRFGNPDFLFFLWIGLSFLLLLLIFGLRMKRKVLLQFQSNVDAWYFKRHKIQALLLMLSYLLVVIAFAYPQWGVKPETVAERLDIIFALDISTSMLANDSNSIRRLTQAKRMIFSLLEQLDGNRIGLLYFAEASIVVCPLTSDTKTVSDILGALTPETLAHRGTRIGNAIDIATDRFVSHRSDTTITEVESIGQKVLIFFTDGEDHEGIAVDAANTAKRRGINIFCVGIGTLEKASPILLPNQNAGYKRDINGQVVLTTLDEEGLREIAKAGNGKYYHASDGITQLTTDLSRLRKQRFSVSRDGEFQERYQWFVGLALILLLVEVFVERWKIR